MANSLGIDIGGANLKVADSNDFAESIPFPLWKQPERLVEELKAIALRNRHLAEVGITITGELCDAFLTKREGITRILEAVDTAFHGWSVRIWSSAGTWLSLEQAITSYLQVAAANWHALATWVGTSMATEPRALLIDTGSTTTDIIPIVNHEPNTEERTDWGRLQSGELVYTGAKRTPLCALMGQAPSMAEFFATSEDCYVLLEMLPERRHEIDTADGRPMTKEFAHYRISRMIGSDGELLPRRESLRLALSVFVHQQRLIREAIQQVLRRQGVPPAQVIFSGSGEFLARAAWESLTAIQPEVAGAERISLSEFLGPARAEAACAYALARLLENG